MRGPAIGGELRMAAGAGGRRVKTEQFGSRKIWRGDGAAGLCDPPPRRRRAGGGEPLLE